MLLFGRSSPASSGNGLSSQTHNLHQTEPPEGRAGEEMIKLTRLWVLTFILSVILQESITDPGTMTGVKPLENERLSKKLNL